MVGLVVPARASAGLAGCGW